jgi:creatinine amidohydrolase
MTEIRRRDLLLGGMALSGIVGAVNGNVSGGDSMVKPIRFEETAGFEVADLASRCRLAILPLGSLEFHGPHNPLGSDSIIISGIAERVAARTSGLLFPTIRFTQCPAHTAQFRGTMSVRPEVMTMYLADVLRNVERLGFRKIFVLNGHDGNIGPGRGAIAQVADEIKDAALMFVSWWEFLPSEMMNTLGMFHQANGGHGHGGPLETSAVAAFRPDLVHIDQAKDLPAPPDLSGGQPYFLQKSTAAGWPGYSGAISEASAEKGKKIVQISEDRIVRLIENWLEHDEVPGSW